MRSRRFVYIYPSTKRDWNRNDLFPFSGFYFAHPTTNTNDRQSTVSNKACAESTFLHSPESPKGPFCSINCVAVAVATSTKFRRIIKVQLSTAICDRRWRIGIVCIGFCFSRGCWTSESAIERNSFAVCVLTIHKSWCGEITMQRKHTHTRKW